VSNAAHGESQAARPLVLIVDTNAATVEDMATVVRREGYTVLKALTFEDGKQLLRSQSPDVLIVDIRLGQYNGLQLLMRAQFDRPDLSSVVTSPVPDPVLEAEAIRFGGTFLIKPVSPSQLLDAIRASARRARSATPPFLERRREERRRLVTPDFIPERRVGERRRPSHPVGAAPAESQSGPDHQQPPPEDTGQQGVTRRPGK
jgi:DNA-binding response OmpR family regulator